MSQPVNKYFPTREPFDKAYATPERLQAALSDAPLAAEISEDAWAFGMTVHWLLTGRDEIDPGSNVMVRGGRDVGNDSDSLTCAKVRNAVCGAGDWSGGERLGKSCRRGRRPVRAKGATISTPVAAVWY